MNISLCIATYRRPERLAALLAWILFRAGQELATVLTAARRLDRPHTGPPL